MANPAYLAAVLALTPVSAPPAVHSVCDISQQFTFYMDGRFHRQYLAEVGRDARNWGSLSKLELSNTNLLVLTGGNERIPYDRGGLRNISRFVRDGGTLLLMADGAATPPPGDAVAQLFKAQLSADRAEAPLDGIGLEDRSAEISFRGGGVLDLARAGRWETLVADARGRPVLATRRAGKGHVLVGSRGLFGQRPDASDPINADWITPLLVAHATRKSIDPALPHRSTAAEHRRKVEALTLEFHDGTRQFADAIHEVYREVYPHLLEITGVEPAPGMIKSLLVLPTGGGGFSSGARIAIGAWWGGFPERRYPMVELIGHEAGHSWVLPHPEPLWNEPIATYLGIRVGQRLGLPDADATLERQLAAGRTHDPEYTAIDPQADDAPRDLIWGKSYYVFEELSARYGVDALARYFRTKRATVPAGRASYTMDDCVAVWSIALGEDLFPWFRSLAFDVDAARSDLARP